MRKLLGTIILIGLGLGLQGCAPKLSPEESCNFVQNADQQRVSWGSGTFVFLLDQSVPSAYVPAIKAAAKTWNDAIHREVIKIGGYTNSSTPAQDGANIIYFLNTWEADRTNEQARTTVYWTGNRIYEADIRVNNRDFQYFWSDDVVAGKVDIQSLILHEMGHSIGLAHNTATGSVMAKSLPNAYLRRDLGSADLGSISCEY